MRLIDADKLNARLSRNGTPYYKERMALRKMGCVV